VAAAAPTLLSAACHGSVGGGGAELGTCAHTRRRRGGTRGNAQDLIRAARGQTISLRQRKVGVKYVEADEKDLETEGDSQWNQDMRAAARRNREFRDKPRARAPKIDWMDGVKAKPFFLFSVRRACRLPSLGVATISSRTRICIHICAADASPARSSCDVSCMHAPRRGCWPDKNRSK
jgi:hypothetical protein